MTGLMVSIFFACKDDDNNPPLLKPSISQLSPGTGPVGTAVTITGLNFGSNPIVKFGTTDATATGVTTTSITTEVPPGLPAGTVDVTVTNDGSVSDAEVFTVTEATTPPPTGSPANAADALDTAADETLTSLAAAVEAAGLTATLNDAEAVTIFAPNNDAFTELIENTEDVDDLTALVEALGQATLSGILQAHVLGSTVNSEGAIAAAAAGDSVQTLNANAKVLITQEGENLFVNGAQILQPDIIVGNGVIHVIDSVINTGVAGGEDEEVIVPDQTQVGDDDLARDVALELIDNFNAIIDLGLTSTSVIPTTNLEFVTNQLAEYPDDDFFDEVNFKGAVDPSGTPWIAGWTLLDQGGYLTGSPTAVPAFDQAAIEGDASVLVALPQRIVGDRTFNADSIYYIDGYTFVEDGELTIPAGTVIIAETTPSTGDPLSALVITRSATIQAIGTAEDPIIMTSENDFDGGGLDQVSTSEWGGLAILGEAPIENDGPEAQIEGIPTELPALYGGDTPEDNSGTVTYISIRYTGAAISEGNELQGLSLGGVGSGTTIEYIESFASGDDGVEVFGGAANIKYFVAAFAEDDSYDFDNGWVGNGQFLLAIQGSTSEGSLIEGDGTDPLTAELISNPTLYNMTLIGIGATGQGILLRDRAAGTIANSIFVDQDNKGIQVEDIATEDNDSYANLVNGDLQLLNNLWYGGATFTQFNSTASGIIQATEE